MVKIRIKNAYDAFVKGNALMLFSSLGVMSFVSLIVLVVLGVVYYFEMGESWALIIFAVITVGFVIFSLCHLMAIPMLAKNDEYFGKLAVYDVTVIEDSGLYVEGYDNLGQNIHTFTVYWDDINRITYNKHFFAIQCFGSEMIFIEDKNAIYKEGNPKTLEYYLRNNVDRRSIKIDKWKKVVK